MRTKHINGEEAVLMCGGPGFKVYGVADGYIVSLGRRNVPVPKSSTYFKPVGRYTMLKYLSGPEKEQTKKAFDDLINLLKRGA